VCVALDNKDKFKLHTWDKIYQEDEPLFGTPQSQRVIYFSIPLRILSNSESKTFRK
jgi:hypothetical protein